MCNLYSSKNVLSSENNSTYSHYRQRLSPCAVHQVQKLASKNKRMRSVSIDLEVAEVEGQLVSAQTIRHTLQLVGLHGRCPRRKPLLKLAHKKACKQFAEDNLAKSMDYWNHVLWSDESKVNLFDSDSVQHVRWRPCEEYQENCAMPTVKHGGGSQCWGKLLLKVMHYNVALLPKKVTNYIT